MSSRPSILRTVFTILVAVPLTTVLGLLVIVAAAVGVRDRPGSVYDNVPRWWSKGILWAAGVKVRLHNSERGGGGQARIFVANHLSWFDVPALAAVLPRYKFVAKSELFKVPVFGWAIRAIGMVEIQRENRRQALDSYEVAAAKIREGNSIVIFPEGTRGTDYRLRPFKKGPFVLALAAGVPIVPVVVHGALEVIPRGAYALRPGTIDVHLLPEVPTAGLGYDDRDKLTAVVRDRMAAETKRLYGVDALSVNERGKLVPETPRI